MNSILNIQVSCFANYDTPANPKQVNLLAWLKSDKHRDKVERIRSIEGKKERDELKATLPAITASGLFSYRAKKNLIKHSGLIAIDIDFTGNEHIGNFAELKTQLCNISNVAYCGLSVSGRGYYCVLPIAYPDKHELYFRSLQRIFKSFGITIDPACIDVSRLRGYSYDHEGYFNHEAKVFSEYKEPVRIKQRQNIFKAGAGAKDKISIAVKMINEAAEGEKHHTLLKAATLMGGYIATGEVDEDTAIDAMETAIQSRDIKSIEDAKKTIRKGIAYGMQSPISSAHSFDMSAYKPHQTIKPQSQGFDPSHPKGTAQADELQQVEDISTVNEPCQDLSKTETWDQDIAELENYFMTASLPTVPVKLTPCTMLTNANIFICSHLAIVKANNGNRTFLPYLHRLQELKTVLTLNIN